MTGQLMCPCGQFQSQSGHLWTVAADATKMAPVCPACGERIAAGETAQPADKLALISVVNIDKLSEPSLAAILNAKAALAAQFHWAEDPDYQAWTAQAPRQYLRAATDAQFETIVKMLAPEQRILIRDFTRPDAPRVLLWVLPMRSRDIPPILGELRFF